ncbi:MAG: DUF1667 domain-containing protein [Oscillospiraceae bacterium]|nr:DUF1667 domain-containing protein [Oscillospiraceae bacterium]
MKELICITCPKGCHLKVDEETFAVTGNSCPRGAVYGANELRNPVRVITSTVRLESETFRRLPVKTDRAVPKAKMFEVMDEIARVRANAPVKVGDILIANVAGTDGNVVATRTVEK